MVSAFVLDSRFGLDQGFASYDDDLSGGHESAMFLVSETGADGTVDRALAWLDGKGERPWFLWTHFFDPHAEYRAPEPYGSRLAPYDAEIAFVDAQLGRLLDAIAERGELERTLVVVTADHGESLGEHGEATHGVFIYDATTRVPLLLSHPSLALGKRVSEVVSSVDISPTCLELLGIECERAFDGRSLA